MADSTYTGVKYFIVGIVLGGIFGLEAVAFNSDGMGAPAVAFLGIQSGLVGFLAARWRATMSPLPLGMSMGMVATLIMAAATARTAKGEGTGFGVRLFDEVVRKNYEQKPSPAAATANKYVPNPPGWSRRN